MVLVPIIMIVIAVIKYYLQGAKRKDNVVRTQQGNGCHYANANGTRHVQACQCHWGRTGLGLQMPLGPGRPGLVNAHRPGQALTCQFPWDRADLDLSMQLEKQA